MRVIKHSPPETHKPVYIPKVGEVFYWPTMIGQEKYLCLRVGFDLRVLDIRCPEKLFFIYLTPNYSGTVVPWGPIEDIKAGTFEPATCTLEF